jgi:hypothetical protein
VWQVTGMVYLFCGCASLTHFPRWPGAVPNVDTMFEGTPFAHVTTQEAFDEERDALLYVQRAR